MRISIVSFTCMFYILDAKPTFISKIVTEIQISYQRVNTNQHQWPLGSLSEVTEEASR